MIIDNSNIRCIATLESKNNAPLIIDANRVEPLPAPLEGFQAVSRRHSQIAQLHRIVQVKNLAARCAKQRRGKCPRLSGSPVVEQVLCQIVAKGFNHVITLSQLDNLHKLRNAAAKRAPNAA